MNGDDPPSFNPASSINENVKVNFADYFKTPGMTRMDIVKTVKRIEVPGLTSLF